MPAHRKPTAVLELSGAWQKNPQRRRTEPKPRAALGRAPKQSPISFAQAWKLIVSACPEGVLADRDRLIVEIAASLLVQFRDDPAKMPTARLQRLTSILGELGMSPASASRVTVPKPKDEFDEWD